MNATFPSRTTVLGLLLLLLLLLLLPRLELRLPPRLPLRMLQLLLLLLVLPLLLLRLRLLLCPQQHPRGGLAAAGEAVVRAAPEHVRRLLAVDVVEGEEVGHVAVDALVLVSVLARDLAPAPADALPLEEERAAHQPRARRAARGELLRAGGRRQGEARWDHLG